MVVIWQAATFPLRVSEQNFVSVGQSGRQIFNFSRFEYSILFVCIVLSMSKTVYESNNCLWDQILLQLMLVTVQMDYKVYFNLENATKNTFG